MIARNIEVRKALFSTKPIFVLLCKGPRFLIDDSKTSLPSVFLSLLQEFKDIFPEELPSGLPPLRGIEHQIDFLPGAVIPNRPTYRANPIETKEIQK